MFWSSNPEYGYFFNTYKEKHFASSAMNKRL